MDFIERAMNVYMPVNLLIEANKRHAELDSEDRSDITAWTIEWIKMLDEYEYSEEQRRDLLLALGYRIEALCRFEISKYPETAGWILPSKDGSVYTSHTVFQAAAEHPLSVRDERAYFEPKSFIERLHHISVFRSFDDSRNYAND